MRLDRYLHEAGLGTRREVNLLVRARRVTLGGALATDGAMRVAPGAAVAVDGAPAELPRRRIVLFHKPPGFVTAARDAQKTIYALLPFTPHQLLPVGRLDRQSEGLLILTNDGQLIHRLTAPRRHVEKEYICCVDPPPTPAALARLGATLDIGRGERSQPARAVEWLGPAIVKIMITEGKYHQVRRMLEAIGSRVTRLKRTRVGPVALGDLAPGAWRDVTDSEARAVDAATGLSTGPPPDSPPPTQRE